MDIFPHCASWALDEDDYPQDSLYILDSDCTASAFLNIFPLEADLVSPGLHFWLTDNCSR